MRHATVSLLFVLLLSSISVAQTLTLADPFGDAMVLQREMPVPIWGTAAPKAKITVSFGGQEKTVYADATGKWLIKLDPLPAAMENRELTAASDKERIVLKNVLVGEVWLCSGQSNMEWGLAAGVIGGKESIEKGNHPLIRLRYVNKTASPQAETRLNGSEWMICSPANLQRGTNAKSFSAVAYFYGLQLFQKLNVPVGIIQSAWGGTRIEPWCAPEGFRSVPGLEKFAAPVQKANQGTPGGLYNAMIHPWVPYAIRGAIWYQGESNIGQTDYTEKMRALIQGWRTVWQQGNFPFYYVQLAPFSPAKARNPDLLPMIWEQQTAALEIPNTGMAIINDIGNLHDIHPRNKLPVAERLARLAFSRTYGLKYTDDSGPIFKSAEFMGNTAVVHFSHAESGLASRDGKPISHFEIAGPDGKFFPATATINGKTIKASSPSVSQPTQIRFAWKESAEPNLMNGDNLPASAFRYPIPKPPAK